LAILFVAIFSALLFRKHAAFNTRTYDLARFDQAIWNTLHGRFLFSTIGNHSVLGNHFSPLMALLSPLFLIWNDVRVLFLAQVIGIAAAGLFLYGIVRVKHPRLALPFLVAFYLNPALHEITTFEFRRVALAVPFLAMALYALTVRKRWWMVLGLGLALLCKENVGFVVLMIGIYLSLSERDWKWGLPLIVVGAAWVIAVSLWVIPAFAPPGENAELYPQLYYFRALGDSYQEILSNVLHDPLVLVRQMFDLERIRALGRLFLPLGLVLPFLAPEWALICLPTMAYMLLSDDPRLYRFEAWRLATVLPVLFAAAGVGLGRLSRRWAGYLTMLLVGTTVVGYFWFSPAPFGGAYDASLYDVTEHHRLAAEIVKTIPADASVATQARYVPHLSHREHVYHYPWIVIGVENTDYILLDRHSNPYPFSPDELDEQIDNLMSDTSYTIEAEADGIFLFRKQDWSFSNRYVVEDTMGLACGQVAVQDKKGGFWPVVERPVELKPGQRVRVSLHWEALADITQERTISVRIADASGRLVAQHDGWPGQGTKPTSWWKKGWTIRDIHYLDVSPDAQPVPGALSVVVYDSYSGEMVPIDGEVQMLRLCEVTITP
jgi:uncharacterized membrane protein